MTVVERDAVERMDPRCEYDAGVARIVVGGVLDEATAAAAREMLLEACDRGTTGVVLVIEAEVDPVNHDVLRHLVDVAQRRCWAASRRLDLVATDRDVCEALAAVGVWSSVPAVVVDKGTDGPCD
ncbi:hypothetical protein AB0P21_27385 [Kribbella sp. NPDC056861]|uniref:STAS domain-containing protein n=1 Tax=Kribbella sp. NPDC056861 TaxID=3154857 RepID=UPI003414D864